MGQWQQGGVGGGQGRPAGGQHLVREQGRGSLQGVGSRRLSVVEVEGGEGGGRQGGEGGEGGQGGGELGVLREGAVPGYAHTPVHLYQG